MTVLLLSGVKGDTRRYRTFHTYEQLRLAGLDCRLAHITDSNLVPGFKSAEIILLHRVAYNSQVENLLQIARSQGALTILDTDDLIFDPAAFRWINSPDFADPVRVSLYQEDIRRNRTTLDTCQVVTTSTDFLAKQVRTLGKATWVLRNAFSLEMLSTAPPRRRLRSRPTRRSCAKSTS